METLTLGNLKIEKIDDSVQIYGLKDFNLVHIFECGQCFRWKKTPDNGYSGIASGKMATVYFDNDILTIKNTTIEEFSTFWYVYFDLGRDYSQIKNELSSMDVHLKRAVDFGDGIRILSQDFFETLISFIISANNNIPRIKKSVELIAKHYGKMIDLDNFTFPDSSILMDIPCEELSLLSRAGFRCKYIENTSNKYAKEQTDISILSTTSLDNARKILKEFTGVGDKVADCVLLFSGCRQDVFPTDVWVKRVMEELYFGRTASLKEINDFAKVHFGKLSGFAQQYLFYYAREHRIGL